MQRPYSAQHNNAQETCPAAKKLKQPNFKKSQMRFESHLDNLMLANQDYFDHIAPAPVDFINATPQPDQNQIIKKIMKPCITHIITIIPRVQDHYQNKASNHNYEELQIQKIQSNITTYQRPLTAIPSVQQKDIYSQPTGKVPFTAVTHYKNEFQQWPDSKVNLIEPQPNQAVLKDLPFSSSTSYNKDYAPKIHGKGDKEIEKLLNNARFSKFKSPIGQDIPLMATTTSANAFMPYKTFTYNNKKYNARPSLKFPPYAQQYQTQYNRDYDEKGKKDCPASYYEKIKTN